MFKPDDLQFAIQAEPVLDATQLERELGKLVDTAKKSGSDIGKAISAGLTDKVTDLKLTEARTDALKGATEQLEKQRIELEKIRALMNPDLIAAQVAMERELTKAAEERSKAMDKERREQERPGFFQKLFQDPSATFKDMKSGLSKFMKEMTEEFNKGGIGGLIDKAFGAGKGKGAGGGADATNTLLAGILGGQSTGSMAGEIGGMIGMAVGGPAGAMIGSKLAEMAVKAITATIGAPAKALSMGLSGVSNSLLELNGILGPIGIGFNAISGVLESYASVIKSIPIIGDLFGPMLDQLAMIPGILKDITSTLTQFAGVASPGMMKSFQWAIKDVQGVIGQSFLPVLELMRDGIKLVGDTIATILPNTGEMRGALTDVRNALVQFNVAFRGLMQEVGPTLRSVLISNIKMVSFGISLFVNQLTLLARGFEVVAWPITNLLRLLGLVDDSDPRSATGAAARPANFQGFEQYQQQIQTAAYTEPGLPTENEVPSMIAGISRNIERIIDLMERFLPLLNMFGGSSNDSSSIESAAFGVNPIERGRMLWEMIQGLTITDRW